MKCYSSWDYFFYCLDGKKMHVLLLLLLCKISIRACVSVISGKLRNMIFVVWLNETKLLLELIYSLFG